MEQVDVVAIVGTCAPERHRYAKTLAATQHRMLIDAQRLASALDPIDEAAALAPWADQPAGTVCEFPNRVEMTELIGSLAHPEAETQLSDIVCVVDAAHILDDLEWHATSSRHTWSTRWPAMRPRSVNADLAVSQIEFASVIMLVNWETVPTDKLSTVMSLMNHLGPHARLQLERNRHMPPADGSAPYVLAQERPGWVSILNGDYTPHMLDPHVGAYRYEQVRPFHPGRLRAVLDEHIDNNEFGLIIRSAGFCRFATRPETVAHWDHVGTAISFSPRELTPVVTDPVGAFGDDMLAVGQDLAFIGLDLDSAALTKALDDAALSDGEFTAGPQILATFDDPFPTWPRLPNRAE